ncbi:anillin, actin binding protein 2 isoform X7 [Nerophis lumbriciformis]|uniref:anillin, actin binding protein 2 isoform X7 n=1 Tax=Nerophis lumbriciformis TaxID=546530 RepID=UPI002ADF67DC|nr:anillin, actin binding protein 2 isoform X7 [Nerophis lumbriciformis]
MEAGQEISDGGFSLKRQRTPLLDNLFYPSEVNDSQKRPRLEVMGRENRSPRASSSGRGAEVMIKPDTPIVPSVRSRVQQLAERRDVVTPLTQRCLSDPGDDITTLLSKGKFCHDHLLSEEDFHKRMERFKGPFSEAGPDATPSPSKPPSRNLSELVSGIQQKLQGDATPSSKQASRIRQEREQEMNQLHLQPIKANAWLKRSSSDPLLCQERTPSTFSTPSWTPRIKRVVQWPPMRPWDLDAEMKDGSFSETIMSGAQNSSLTDVEPSYHDETNTAEIIDQMFDEVLEYAERIEEKRSNDEGTLGRGIAEKEDVVIESEQGKNNQINGKKEECDEIKKLEANGDELLFPPTGILSPLSKSVEAAVTPLRLEATKEEYSPSLPLTPEETPLSPLYSIDAYRTQRQSEMPTIQSVTPGLQRKLPEKPQPQSSTNTKEKIAMLNEEVAKLQIVINQTLQALSCCTDEEHGQGSLEEAEAEKLLLVSCEKRSAVLDEVARLREERCLDSSGEEHVMQQPCRGTVNISNIQLPLKVEFVCSSHNHAGRPSHYFFILIRYGAYNIVATPLATAATAQNGDTISFPTSITLKDIRSTFEIDVEVYSLSHTSVINSGIDRITTKSRVTPRKLLNTITKASNSLTAAAIPALNIRRSSNFTLVGSHKITLSSLGHSKFSLDKMKLEGKIRKLLGDEFQEKVPFLSPLEGNIYLQLHSESHSRVQHHGFLTMFELISGLGVWHRRYFTLDGCSLRYWNHPNDKDSKEAEGVLSLSSSPSQCVRPVKKGSCARPFTFELVSAVPQDDSQESLTKCWFSADTNQEKLDWMEKLKQALLDFNTWNSTSAQTQQSSNSSVNLRESIL